MKKSIGDNMIPRGWSFEQELELIKEGRGWDSPDWPVIIGNPEASGIAF